MDKRFAFLVHPRQSIARDLARLWRPLGWVPDRFYDWSLATMPIPAPVLGEVRLRGAEETLLGKTLRPFTYPGLGQAASLGVGKGIPELYGLQFTGLLGWIMRLSFFLYFMPSRRQALRVLGNWLSLPLLGRYTMPLDVAQRPGKVESEAEGPPSDRLLSQVQ